MKYVAFDLGASSGKLFEGQLINGQLKVEPIYGFENNVVPLADGLYWDFTHIFTEVCKGLKKAESSGPVDSFGIDSFNNDFSLIDKNGELLMPVRSYRDPRTQKHWDKIFSVMDAHSLYMASGNQIAPFNTLMHLAAMNINGQHWMLDGAYRLLMLPDLLGYYITGKEAIEYTLAAETEFLDLKTKCWIDPILDAYDIPKRLLPELHIPGTILGRSTDAFNERCRVKGFDFVNVCEHDTASAFLSAPCGTEAAYISSGTWSLVGLEAESPVISEFTYAANIANEGGPDGHHRLLKNVMGSWLLQELRRDYAADGIEFDYVQTQQLALEAEPFAFPMDPDSEILYQPGMMRRRIREACKNRSGRTPETPGEYFRCVYEALAMKYRFCVDQLETATGRKLTAVNVFGGGCQDAVLNQFTADACGRKVVAGPADASSIGNILMQMLAHGEITSIEEGRELVRKSFPIKTFEPKNATEWNEHFAEYKNLYKNAPTE